MYRFDVSVSTTESRTKEEIKYNNLSFEKKNISVEEFITLIKKGHTFCHCFNKSNFPSKEKTLENFKYSNVIAFDFDDYAVAMNDCVYNLKFKPSVAYTSYSNGEKGNRFRLIYLFNERIDGTQFKCLYDAILNSNNVTLKDNCMSSVNQCFIGNGKSNVEVINNNIVYNISDFKDFVISHPEIANKIYKPNNNTTVISLNANSGCSVNDYVSMSFENYYNKYKDAYRLFSSTDLEYNEEGFALIDDNYISIQRLFQWITEENGKKYCIKIKWRDGEKRFKKLFCSAMLRRKIKNDITFDELLFNTANELEMFYFNDDNRFSKKDVLRIVEKVMSLPIDKVNSIEHYKDKRRFALNPEKFNGRNEKSAARQRINKKLNYEEISKYFNPELKDKENLEILKANGVKVSARTLTNYKKEMGIKKLSKNEEIGSMYDPTLSDKENVECMKQFGLTVTTDDLCRWRYKNKIKLQHPEIANKIYKPNNNTTVISLNANSGCNEEVMNTTEYKETDRYIAEIRATINKELNERNNYLEGLSMSGLFNPMFSYLMKSEVVNEEKIYALDWFVDYSRFIYEKNNDYASNLEILFDSVKRLLKVDYNKPLAWIEAPYNASITGVNTKYQTA